MLSDPKTLSDRRFRSNYVEGRELVNFEGGPKPWFIIKDKQGLVDDYFDPVDQDEQMLKFIGKNAYELYFRNEGGLISPMSGC